MKAGDSIIIKTGVNTINVYELDYKNRNDYYK